MEKQTIEIYTDGSCNPKYGIGGWAAIILIYEKNVFLQGAENETTHNRMELTAVIKAIEYVLEEFSEITFIKIYTDSQYVEQIQFRADKLQKNDFITKAGNKLQNTDLIKKLIDLSNTTTIEFIKVKAHQKNTKKLNFNREVDKLARKIVREQIKKTINR